MTIQWLGTPVRAGEVGQLGQVPRRGPNNTVLFTDLPEECQGAYDAAFGGSGPSGCALAREFADEWQRLEDRRLRGESFSGDAENQEILLAAQERAEAACNAAIAGEAQAIQMWVNCLSNIGLAPGDVWAGSVTPPRPPPAPTPTPMPTPTPIPTPQPTAGGGGGGGAALAAFIAAVLVGGYLVTQT